MCIITDILKEIPLSAVLREKIIDLEKTMSEKDAKIKELEISLQNASLIIEQQTQKTKKLENFSQDTSLEENEIKIILFLANTKEDRRTSENMSRSLKINLQVIKFHLEELKKYNFIKYKPYFPSSWYLTQEGRRYLIENKLIE